MLLLCKFNLFKLIKFDNSSMLLLQLLKFNDFIFLFNFFNGKFLRSVHPLFIISGL